MTRSGTNAATDAIREAIAGRAAASDDRDPLELAREIWERAQESEGLQAKPSAGSPSAAAGIGRAFGNKRGADKPSVRQRPAYSDTETAEALDQAIDYNPDASFAAWIYKRLGLDDYELRVENEDGEADDELAAEVEAFASRVMMIYGGGIDAIRNVALDSILRRGAACPELDVADSLDEVVEVDFVDPIYVDVEDVPDGVHSSSRWVYNPSGGGEPIPFNPAQFCVFAVGQKVGDPRGQSPFLPLIDTVFPHTELRNSLQRVAKNQAFSRILLSYSMGALMEGAPAEMVRRNADGQVVEVLDHEGFQDHVSTFVDDLSEKLDDMLEDDNWLLPDSIVADSLGANHSGESLDFQKLGQLFEQDVISSVKNQPAIHGRQWGSDLSSTGSVQWKVQALGIESTIVPANRAAEFVCNQWLRITGRRGKVTIVSPAIEKTDRLAEAQARQIEVAVWAQLYEMGVVDLAEMAQETTGHEPPEVADAPETGRITTDQVLNGAQVTSAQSIITDIALGVLPRATGINMISAFFNLPRETVDEIVGEVGMEGAEAPPVTSPEQPDDADETGNTGEDDPDEGAGAEAEGTEDEGRGDLHTPRHSTRCSCDNCTGDDAACTECGGTVSVPRHAPGSGVWLSPFCADCGHQLPKREPFTPANPGDVLNSLEMVDEPDPDDEDAARVERAFRRRMRSRGLDTFAGMLDAVVVSSAPGEDEDEGRAIAWQRADDPKPGRWQFDENLARWRYPTNKPGRLGRLLPDDRAYTLMEIGRKARQKEAASAAQALADGRITVREWQERTRALIKDAHLEARMVAAGGKNNMTQADYGAVGGRLQSEYAKLGEIGQDIAAGRYSPAQVQNMTRTRFEAQIRETFRRGEQAVRVRAGYREEANELEPGAEHCDGCLNETRRSWVPIGSIVPVGSRDCSIGCHCRIRYRVSEDRPRPASRQEGALAWTR